MSKMQRQIPSREKRSPPLYGVSASCFASGLMTCCSCCSSCSSCFLLLLFGVLFDWFEFETVLEEISVQSGLLTVHILQSKLCPMFHSTALPTALSAASVGWIVWCFPKKRLPQLPLFLLKDCTRSILCVLCLGLIVLRADNVFLELGRRILAPSVAPLAAYTRQR